MFFTWVIFFSPMIILLPPDRCSVITYNYRKVRSYWYMHVFLPIIDANACKVSQKKHRLQTCVIKKERKQLRTLTSCLATTGITMETNKE